MTRIIAVVSQKGGVGKTSLVQNLGAELALAGQRTLLIDFDPQSNLTTGWGIDPSEERLTVYDSLTEPRQAPKAIINLRPHLDLLPANLDLAGAELAFINAPGLKSSPSLASEGLKAHRPACAPIPA